eukprot:scaffold14127_cov36-Attheya_sp.AAC.1
MLSIQGDGIYLSGISMFQDGVSQSFCSHRNHELSVDTKCMFAWSLKFGSRASATGGAAMTRGGTGVIGGATAIRGATDRGALPMHFDTITKNQEGPMRNGWLADHHRDRLVIVDWLSVCHRRLSA